MENMENKENNSYMGVWILLCLISGGLWLLLLGAKAVGEVSMSWLAVLLGIWWIPLLIFAIVAAVAFVVVILARTKRRIRKWKVNRRIIRQAKAAGVWKRPEALGGKALELSAWKEFRIKRQPGETDKELRRRCMAAADAEYANTPTEGGSNNEQL